MPFLTLLRFISGAYLRQRPLKVLLTVLGMASGIAVFIAIQIANQSILYSFKNSIEQLSGQSDLTLVAQTRKVTDADYVRVKNLPGVSEATPIIEVTVTCPQNPQKKARLLAIEPISRAAFFPKKSTSLSDTEKKLGEQVFNLMLEPGMVLVPENFLKACSTDLKSAFQIKYAEKNLSFPYEVYAAQGSVWESSPTLLTDIATAQELLGMLGQFSQIEIKLSTANITEWKEKNEALFAPALSLVSQEKRFDQGKALLSAFQHNLLSLGLISIFVAVFIVYNAASISLLYRRSQLAVLRALGASRPRVWAIFLIEILGLGLFSSCLGVVLGWLVASLIFNQILETVHQHYLSGVMGVLSLSKTTWISGLTLGTVASFVGALFPLLEASSVSPVEATRKLSYERHIRKHPFVLLGLCGMMCGLALLSYLCVSFDQPNWAFLLAFAVLLSLLSLTPFLLQILLRPLKSLFRRWRQPSALMANVQILENPYRYSMVTAALALAIALWIGIGMMVSSFRLSLEDWLLDSVPGDIYVDFERNDRSPTGLFSQEVLNQFQAWPEVDWVDTLKTFDIGFQGQNKTVSVIQLNQLMQRGYLNILSGERKDFSEAFLPQNKTQSFVTAVSESFAKKNQLQLNDTFVAKTPWGKGQFQIKAILYDYSSEQGVIYIDQHLFVQAVQASSNYQAFALYLKGYQNADGVIEKILSLPNMPKGVRVSSQQELHQRVLAIFDQTFQVTQALRVVALFVAFLGILSTLALLMEEKRREVGLLQAIGMGPNSIYRYGFFQGLLLAWVGYFMGACAGVMLCWVIVKVVHYYFFGWSIGFYFNLPLLFQGFILTLATGAFASLWGIHSLKKLQPAEALRFDE